MAIPSEIIGSNGHKADVTPDEELQVIPASYPPITKQKVRPFRQYLTSDGLSSGSNDMGVDGSTANIDFWIPAHETDDRYIKSLSFIVGYGASGQPNQWANGAALTNGSRLFYTSSTGEYDIHDGIKTNQDMFRLTSDLIPTLWEVRHVNANNDYGYFVTMDFSNMGLSFGIKLDKGTTQKLVMRIRDNAGTDADTFDCIAYGFDRFE